MKWKVEHIELFFYNGCDNCWQMFQETTSGADGSLLIHPESFFRIQLQELLRTVRVALTKKGGEIEVELTSPAPDKEIEVKMPQTGESLRKAFAKYCIESLRKEDIRDEVLEKALANLNTGDQFTLPKESVPNLHSILPMARDWDVFGWLHPMSTSSTRFKPEDFWWRFFVYRVAFQRKPSGAKPSIQQPLDYDVFLQLLGSGKKMDGGEMVNPTRPPKFPISISPSLQKKTVKKKGSPL